MDKLPTDIQQNIFSFMSNADVLRSISTSKNVENDIRRYFDYIRFRLCNLIGDAVFSSDVWKLWIFSTLKVDSTIDSDVRLCRKQQESIKCIMHEDFKGDFENPSCVSITMWYTLRIRHIKPFRILSIVPNLDTGAVKVHELHGGSCAITYTRIDCGKEVLLAVYNKNNGMFWPTDQLNYVTCVHMAYALHSRRECSVTGPMEFSRLFGEISAHIKRHSIHNSSNSV